MKHESQLNSRGLGYLRQDITYWMKRVKESDGYRTTAVMAFADLNATNMALFRFNLITGTEYVFYDRIIFKIFG